MGEAALPHARRLIVNADDLGLTSGVNRAVRECRERGVLTSTTLMANAAAFHEGVMIASQLLAEQDVGPQFSVGCHIVLVDGEPLLPASELPTLTVEGRFRRTLSSFATDALRGHIRMEEIEREATAQVQKLQAAGLKVSHFDTHKHVHIFPAVLKGVLRAASNCGVPAVRNPFESNMSMLGMVAAQPALWMRFAQVQVLRRWLAGFVRKVNDFGLATCAGSLGVTLTGTLDSALLTTLLQSMPDGTWELVCHPGYNDADLQQAGTRLLSSRAVEMELLTAPRTRELLDSLGIKLVSYSDLVNPGTA